MPKNSGPNSFAAEVKVLSRVDRDSVMKMMLVMEKVAVPKNLETAVGLPASMLARMACGTLHCVPCCLLGVKHGSSRNLYICNLIHVKDGFVLC